MRNWKLIAAVGAILVIGALVWLFLVNTIRIPALGDRFVYRDQRGETYTFEVTKKDTPAKMFDITGHGDTHGFYDLDLTFSYRSRWLEWTYMRAVGRGFSLNCEIHRGEGGSLMYPVKRLFARPRQFGFRANCMEEGAFAYETRVQFAGRETVKTPAG